MLETGKTSNPYLARIALARMINQASGGAVIAPWEVENLPDDWLDAFRVQASSGQRRIEAKQKVNSAKSAWLKKFTHYRN
jgi:hypothetical protein